MSATPRTLPIIASCDGCGACCRIVTLPPFRRRFDQSGEEAWERLRWDHADLATEILAEEKALRSSGRPSYGTPCLWYDAGTGRCLHYDERPRACHEFERGGVDCHDARRRAGISEP